MKIDGLDEEIYDFVEQVLEPHVDEVGDIVEDAVNWVANNREPDDVFCQNALDDWARNNGWMIDPNS